PPGAPAAGTVWPYVARAPPAPPAAAPATAFASDHGFGALGDTASGVPNTSHRYASTIDPDASASATTSRRNVWTGKNDADVSPVPSASSADSSPGGLEQSAASHA